MVGVLGAGPDSHTSTQLPSVLTAENAGQRALSWPPLRAALSDLMPRWELLAECAPDDRRRCLLTCGFWCPWQDSNLQPAV